MGINGGWTHSEKLQGRGRAWAEKEKMGGRDGQGRSEEATLSRQCRVITVRNSFDALMFR